MRYRVQDLRYRVQDLRYRVHQRHLEAGVDGDPVDGAHDGEGALLLGICGFEGWSSRI